MVWSSDVRASVATRRDTRVDEAALRASFLDYRALLKTNFVHGAGQINLFDVIVGTILADYPVAIAGGETRTLIELYADAEFAIPRGDSLDYPEIVEDYIGAYVTSNNHSDRVLAAIDKFRRDFNNALRAALNDLVPVVNDFLAGLSAEGLKLVGFEFDSLVYNRKLKKFDGATIFPRVTAESYAPRVLQTFLNESRLSALGLALYLAGRFQVVPANSSELGAGNTGPLKLLVLDDVLMGIDHSNRLPLLRLLEQRFADWQIVLLTHDRVWFEMARHEIWSKSAWSCLEMFTGSITQSDGGGAPVSIHCPTIHGDHHTSLSLPKGLLEHAARFLERGHLAAAGNYTRAAYEAALRTTCHEFGIPVAYNVDQRRIKADVFHGAVAEWLSNKPQEARSEFGDLMKELEFHRGIILNPLSHPFPGSINRGELESALRAVERLSELTRAGLSQNPRRIEFVRAILGKSAPMPEELIKALATLKSVFESTLESYCRGKITVTYRKGRPSFATFWSALKRQNPPGEQIVNVLLNNPAQVALIDTWLVAERPDLATLDRATLRKLTQAVIRDGGLKTIFEKE